MNNSEIILEIQSILKDSNIVILDNQTLVDVSKRIASLSISYNKYILRAEFYETTGIAPIFANRKPYMDYIDFLEKKITK